MLRVGEATIQTIFELDASKVITDIMPKATPEAINAIAWLVPNYANSAGGLKAVNQSFLVKIGGSNILIDTCVGNKRERPGFPEWENLNTPYLNNLKQLIDPAEVDFVICTHLHFDHIGWNTYEKDGEWVPTFPNAKYVIDRQEYEYWSNSPGEEMVDDINAIRETIEPLYAANLLHLVDNNQEILPGIRSVSAPGHTPYHVAVLLESRGESALFVGDVFHHPCQIAHPEWESFDTDTPIAIETRKALLSAYADTPTIIIGAHFSEPAWGKIAKVGGGYELVPVRSNIS
jgi:glyoxylase-like metal-dependent hydrolase (beta-lactamase superfamily II)